MTSVKQPLISIVTVVFNGASTLRSTMESVLKQTYSNVEYIIIDGGSTDGTIDIIKEHANNIAFWISEPDKGIYDAMNKGIERATGEWINFMNCGDRFESPTVLATLFDTKISGDILYGDAIIEYPSFDALFQKTPIETIWRSTPFCHQASFAKTSLMKEWKFDLTFRIGSDHDFFYKAYRANKSFVYVDHIVCLFDGRDGATKKNLLLGIEEKFRSALRDDFSIGKWLYAKTYMLYIRLNLFVKKIIGDKSAAWVTRVVRERKEKR